MCMICAHFPSDKDSRRTLEMAVGFFFFFTSAIAHSINSRVTKNGCAFSRREAPGECQGSAACVARRVEPFVSSVST